MKDTPPSNSEKENANARTFKFGDEFVEANRSELVSLAAETQLEAYRATISMSLVALRSAILINGGAIVALVAYLGQLTSNNKGIPDILSGLGFYIIGLLAAVVATGAGYLATYAFGWIVVNHIPTKQNGETWRTISLICIITSYLSFSVGSYICFSGFKSYATAPSGTEIGHLNQYQPNTRT